MRTVRSWAVLCPTSSETSPNCRMLRGELGLRRNGKKMEENVRANFR